MITIYIPNNNKKECEYIINIFFREIFDIEYCINYIEYSDYYEILIDNDRKIYIKDSFFSKFLKEKEYLDKKYIPLDIKFAESNLFHTEKLPVIYGEDLIRIGDDNCTIYCDIDIFASAFFMLTRWEEYVNKARDQHDRFPGIESIAYKYGFLDRPAVNEYAELLWSMLKFLGYNRPRKEHQYQMMLTHDVDEPFEIAYKPLGLILKNIAGDVIKRKEYAIAVKKAMDLFEKTENKLSFDNFFSFDYIMEQSEKRGLESAFYFLPSGSPEMQFRPKIENPTMKNLLKSIHQRGHEIGIHGHYETYRNEKAFLDDVELLKKALNENRIEYQIKGGRQHYLRWEMPTTYYNYQNAGLEYDTTLSYADVAGFRCGICYEFTPFDFLKREKLKIKERPLIAMECSIIDERYMNMGYTERALDYFKKLKDQCRKYNGNFVLLWHNSRLRNDQEKKFYEQVLDC
ncbi:conserved hypothetical protein [uncultured spirochete]|uniref:DUF7033 domain-containing protein n=1 Tax=uncultured spirochete TaxID=156406 RepID=A0A3P3XGG6_9SPIR|nr:conserved hypothetical protein [uncultured spirochete]